MPVVNRGFHQVRRIGVTGWTRSATALRALVALAGRDAVFATKLLDDAADAGEPLTVSRYYGELAKAELVLARHHPERALEMLAGLGSHIGGGLRPVLLEAQALHALRRHADAEARLHDLHRICVRHGLRAYEWRTWSALGRGYAAQRRSADAERAFANAREAILALAANVPSGELRETFLRNAVGNLPRARPPSERRAARQRFGGLTARERDVATLIAQGLSNRAVAEHLVLGERTVENYVSSILNKLGYTSRVQIAAWAVEVGLTKPT